MSLEYNTIVGRVTMGTLCVFYILLRNNKLNGAGKGQQSDGMVLDDRVYEW